MPSSVLSNLAIWAAGAFRKGVRHAGGSGQAFAVPFVTHNPLSPEVSRPSNRTLSLKTARLLGPRPHCDLLQFMLDNMKLIEGEAAEVTNGVARICAKTRGPNG
jgi:hypothetical protein